MAIMKGQLKLLEDVAKGMMRSHPTTRERGE